MKAFLITFIVLYGIVAFRDSYHLCEDDYPRVRNISRGEDCLSLIVCIAIIFWAALLLGAQ